MKVSVLDKEHVRAIETLSKQLQFPPHEVQEIYANELERLALQARIPNFLGVLAASSTRSILRSETGLARSG